MPRRKLSLWKLGGCGAGVLESRTPAAKARIAAPRTAATAAPTDSLRLAEKAGALAGRAADPDSPERAWRSKARS